MILMPTGVSAETYYVSNEGDDAHDGRSEATAWRTVARVNGAEVKPGDTVLLRRGDSWREQLVPHSGSEQAPVTYGAYGSGPKPLLLGSFRKNRAEDWVDEGNNIWATAQPKPIGDQRLPNPSFTDGSEHWSLHSEGGARAEVFRDTSDFDSQPATFAVRCGKPGSNGSHIQLFTTPFAVERGTVYQLTFRVKCSAPFVLHAPSLMKAGAPWSSYCDGPRMGRYKVGPEWTTCTQYYHASTTAADARFTFALGDSLPEGAVLHVDSLQFTAVEGTDLLLWDVGNIIFDGEKSCGVKVWEPGDLKQQGQYWYDEDNDLVKLYSVKSPAEYYSDIECALGRHQISQNNTHYVIYENLALKYGAAHGIGGANTHHIIVRDCDFGFIGGADQMGGDRTVRFGNGVEFWANAHDNLVERCRLWEIYDAALTNQNNGENVRQENIVYRNNVIWNSEYSFEYWNRHATSVTRNIIFENNTCFNAGCGWGHSQRPDPSGRHLCFYSSDAPAENIVIRNNIFDEAVTNAFYGPTWGEDWLASLKLDHNCWFQSRGTMIALKRGGYTPEQFAKYQADTGFDAGSIAARSGLVDPAAGDFHLAAGSPCIDAGTDVGLAADFDGTPVPQGKSPDIGAYEFKSP
jgi:hypothetical protein